MGFTVTEAFVREFESDVYHLAQADRNLSQYARQGTMNAEGKFMDRMGEGSMRERTDRYSRIVYTPVEHSRRYVTPREFYSAELVDRADKLQILQDPGSEYMKAFQKALRRQKTSVFLEALVGTAKTGKDGSGTQALPAGNQVTGASPFSFATVNKTRRQFKNDNVEFEDESPHWAVSPDALEDLANEAVTGNAGGTRSHADYVAVRAIQNGEWDGSLWQGFMWHETTQIPDAPVTANTKQTIAWVPSGAAMVFNNEGLSSIDKLPELHNAWQVYVCFMGGAVRMEEVKVRTVEVENNA